MDVVRFAIMKPVTVVVGIILILLFGVIALNQLPYQLSPNVTEPEITVTTLWPGATPYEIERDVIEEQEDVLKGVANLREMESTSSNNRGQVTLRFKIGTDVDNALLRVSNKLDEVPSYPENVEKPVISATGSESSPVVWTVLKTRQGNDRPLETYRTFFENEARQYLERIDGVSDLFVFGGTEREMHVVVTSEKLAAHQLTVSDVIDRLRAENANVSAGTLAVGRREYRIRSIGEFESPEEIANVVLRSDGQRRVRIGDVASVSYGYEERNAWIIHNYNSGIAVGIRAEPDANVLEVTDAAERVVNELNDGILADNGIYLDWANDQRGYILGAINLLKQNIAIGGVLAICVLLVFLRSFAATLVVSTAIPISIIGTFLLMRVAGSTLNIVSLAGIAFAIGMLVDNAIVVLENIDRHRSMGQRPRDAAYTGAKEVWGAVLASTLTTIAVFLPVVFLEQEAGQLFKDIAIAISGAVGISLFVSVLVIPMFSRQLFRLKFVEKIEHKASQKSGFIGRIGNGLRDGFMGMVQLVLKNSFTRLATAVVLAGAAVVIVLVLRPKMEYLPEGNRNFVINILVAPPGLSFAERKEIGEFIFQEMTPYFEKGYKGLPGIDNMFYVGSDRFMFLGLISGDEQRAAEMIPVCREVLGKVPGVFAISTQAGVFQQGIGRARSIDVDFKGPDLDRLIGAAGQSFGALMGGIPGSQVRPVPNIQQIFPEAQFVPDRDRLVANKMNTRDFGLALDVLMDGRNIGDFKREGEKKIDLVLKAEESDYANPEELFMAMVATPDGKVVPVSSLAELVHTSGITEIRHLERNRTVTLRVTPPQEITLQEAMERIQSEILPGLAERGALEGVDFSISGTADKLTQVRKALQWNFVLAALITYLLMSALFGNFVYPFVIMFTVPMAAAGGFLGLRVVNFFAPQQLDVLTMLGFVILIGVVVNNAILIVHQALNNIRFEGMGHRKAVEESVHSRIRPIYMSATTSIFGMLPLVAWPGPGTELYRGLGSVVIGGLAVSTIFTIFLIPPLLMFFIRMEKIPEDQEQDAPADQQPGEKTGEPA